MNLLTRLRALEAAQRKATAHVSPAAVVVVLAGDALDPATKAEVDAWGRLPLRERRKLAPWGIALFETQPV